MTEKNKLVLNKKIKEILNCYNGKYNSEKNRSEIAYKIKNFLVNKKINWNILNLYTTPEQVDELIVNICIDGKFFPF